MFTFYIFIDILEPSVSGKIDRDKFSHARYKIACPFLELKYSKCKKMPTGFFFGTEEI